MIENNTLTLDQVTAIIDGKRILGNPNEISEVRNAYEAYELMLELDPLSADDLLKAHGLMMSGLIPENGRFRSKGVGVLMERRSYIWHLLRNSFRDRSTISSGGAVSPVSIH